MKCTQCGKELDIRVDIALDFKVSRLKSDETWELIPNSVVRPGEVLCEECFSKFVDVIDKAFNGRE